MNVTKCDLCKKEIKEIKFAVRVNFMYNGYEFCKNCNVPFVKILEKHKLVKKENKEN